MIGKYAAENGATKACRHYSKTLGITIPETTAQRLKSQYLATLNSKVKTAETQAIVPSVQCLPKLNPGRPLLLGKDLDYSIQEFIESLRKVGGVVNTAIVNAAAEGILAAKNPSLLVKHGDHIEITKGWVKSLFNRMGYVKTKGSNAGKITVAHFQEVKEVFLADIQADVLMNDIPPNLLSIGIRLQYIMSQQGSGPCIGKSRRLFLLLTQMINIKLQQFWLLRNR